MNSDAFRAGTDILAGMLAVPIHLDPKITLHALALVLQTLSDENSQPDAGRANGKPIDESSILLTEVPLGITVSGNP